MSDQIIKCLNTQCSSYLVGQSGRCDAHDDIRVCVHSKYGEEKLPVDSDQKIRCTVKDCKYYTPKLDRACIMHKVPIETCDTFIGEDMKEKPLPDCKSSIQSPGYELDRLKEELDRYKGYIDNAISPLYQCFDCSFKEITLRSIKRCCKCDSMNIRKIGNSDQINPVSDSGGPNAYKLWTDIIKGLEGDPSEFKKLVKRVDELTDYVENHVHVKTTH